MRVIKRSGRVEDVKLQPNFVRAGRPSCPKPYKRHPFGRTRYYLSQQLSRGPVSKLFAAGTTSNKGARGMYNTLRMRS